MFYFLKSLKIFQIANSGKLLTSSISHIGLMNGLGYCAWGGGDWHESILMLEQQKYWQFLLYSLIFLPGRIVIANHNHNRCFLTIWRSQIPLNYSQVIINNYSWVICHAVFGTQIRQDAIIRTLHSTYILYTADQVQLKKVWFSYIVGTFLNPPGKSSRKHALIFKMHHAFCWSFIFSTYGLYFLPGSIFAPFEEVKVPVSNSADFFPKKCPLEDLGGFEVVRVNLALKMNVYPEQIQKVCTSHQTLAYFCLQPKFLSGKNLSLAAHAVVQTHVCYSQIVSDD